MNLGQSIETIFSYFSRNHTVFSNYTRKGDQIILSWTISLQVYQKVVHDSNITNRIIKGLSLFIVTFVYFIFRVIRKDTFDCTAYTLFKRMVVLNSKTYLIIQIPKHLSDVEASKLFMHVCNSSDIVRFLEFYNRLLKYFRFLQFNY